MVVLHALSNPIHSLLSMPVQSSTLASSFSDAQRLIYGHHPMWWCGSKGQKIMFAGEPLLIFLRK